MIITKWIKNIFFKFTISNSKKKYDKFGLKPIQLLIGSGKFFIKEFRRIFQNPNSTVPAINIFILIDSKENLEKKVRLYQGFYDLK